MHTRAFDFAIERIGLDEEAYPKSIDGGVGHAEDQAVENVADQRAKNCGALVRGPIEWLVSGERQERELAKKPPENAVCEAPAHAGAVTANIALEQHAEGHADEQRHTKMQNDNGEARRRAALRNRRAKENNRRRPPSG